MATVDPASVGRVFVCQDLAQIRIRADLPAGVRLDVSPIVSQCVHGLYGFVG
jgi:hypothetical protein